MLCFQIIFDVCRTDKKKIEEEISCADQSTNFDQRMKCLPGQVYVDKRQEFAVVVKNYLASTFISNVFLVPLGNSKDGAPVKVVEEKKTGSDLGRGADGKQPCEKSPSSVTLERGEVLTVTDQYVTIRDGKTGTFKSYGRLSPNLVTKFEEKVIYATDRSSPVK